ncbi:glycosyltransferase family 4 protein [Parafilimonas sp.]|uniref:glycosyltransferase family 4 protein n=1 Tax=Parafilimonas sp. TaxID=1969739 RepID=UPI0039E5994A
MEKKKIKILQAIRQGKVGGGESHILSLVKHIDRTIFEPAVLSFTDGQMITELNHTGIENFVIPSEKPFDFTTWNKVKKLMQQEQVDLVHIHGTRATSNIYWAAKNLHLPVVYTIHGWSFHDDQSFFTKKARILFEQWITKKTNCNISVSASNQNTGKANIPNFSSTVIYNGIDVAHFNPANTDRRCVRRELNIPADAFVTSFIGRVTIQKNPLGLIQAFKKVAEANPKAILLMVGDGDLKKAAIQSVKELGLEKSVVFENFRTDVADILFSSDVYCLPSLWEGFPIGLLEAMAMSKPVIATKVDGSSEIIHHNKNGLLIEPQQDEALSTAMLELMNNETLRTALGKAARQTITDNFDVCKMTRQIENIYSNILSNN